MGQRWGYAVSKKSQTGVSEIGKREEIGMTKCYGLSINDLR
jgi:hypothetical protein